MKVSTSLAIIVIDACDRPGFRGAGGTGPAERDRTVLALGGASNLASLAQAP